MPGAFDVDDGLADLVDTLAGEASPEMAAEVHRRLDADPGFRHGAAPIVAAWKLDLRPRTPACDAADARTAWAQVRSQVAANRAAEGHTKGAVTIRKHGADQPAATTRELRRRRAIYARLFGPTYGLGLVLATALGASVVSAALGREWLDAMALHVADRVLGRHAQVIRAGRSDAARDITLPDGSRVVLGSRSWLRYPNAFGTETRAVRLEGEATFTVAPQPGAPPFTVEAGVATIEAVGTVFTVRAHPEQREIRIEVSEGRVRIRALHQRYREPTTIEVGQVANVVEGVVRVERSTSHSADR